MSGEAAWLVTSKLFTLAILSGAPAWTPTEASRVEQQLRTRYAPLVPSMESAVAARSAELHLAELVPNESYADAPDVAGEVIEDRPGKTRPDRDPHSFKPGARLRARLTISARHKPSGEGFNLVINITARVRRTQLDALALSVASVLFPGAAPEQFDLR